MSNNDNTDGFTASDGGDATGDRRSEVSPSQATTPPPEVAQSQQFQQAPQAPQAQHPAPVPGWAGGAPDHSSEGGQGHLGQNDELAPPAASAAKSSMVSAWRWAVATLFVFPLLGFWALPEAAQATLAASRGDSAAAHAHQRTARVLGLCAIAIGVVLFVLFLILVIAGALTADATVEPSPYRSGY